MEIIFQWETLFCRVLKEKGVFKGRVGVDGKVNERIKSLVPEVSFVDASELLREM